MVNQDRISISKNLYQLPPTPSDMRLANLSAQNNFTTIVNINARYRALTYMVIQIYLDTAYFAETEKLLLKVR